jgi:hypothetical protein
MAMGMPPMRANVLMQMDGRILFKTDWTVHWASLATISARFLRLGPGTGYPFGPDRAFGHVFVHFFEKIDCH